MRKLATGVLLLLAANCYSQADKPQAPAIDNSVHFQESIPNPDPERTAKTNDAENPVFVKVIPSNTAERDKQYADEKDDEKLGIERTGVTLNRLIAIFTGIMAIFTIGLFITARKTMRNQLRAYVHFKTIEIKVVRLPTGTAKKFLVIPIWLNAGDTPTRHLTTSCNFGVVDSINDISQYEDRTSPPPESFVLAPKSDFCGDGLPMDIAQHGQVCANAKKLFVWGWTDYTDIFSWASLGQFGRRRTEFCVEVTFIDQLTNIPAEKTIVWCRHVGPHNGADSDCMKKPQPYKG